MSACSACNECGHATEWTPDVGSAVCTHCGTLANPTQITLTDASDFPNDSFVRQNILTYSRPVTLKSVRTDGWDLVGQGKGARHERNKIAIHELICTLALRLASPGSAPRAQVLFDQALDRAGLRWGRAATLAAGAALALAMREAGNGDPTCDIAYLLSVTSNSVKRMVSRVLHALELNLPPSPPTTHIPALLDHIISFISNTSGPSSLPADTLAFLRPFVPSALSSIARTAVGLYDVLAFPSTTTGTKHPLLTLPPAPLAPALVLLALEAHSKPPRAAPHVLALAAQLGIRVGVAGTTVMERYRALCNIICDVMDDIPWLAISAATKGKSTSVAGKRRHAKGDATKAARRTAIARAVVDVVQFRETLWKQRVEEDGPVTVTLEVDTDEDGSKSDDGEGEQRGETLGASPPMTGVKRKRVDANQKPTEHPRKTKKPRTAQGLAARFLLDPLAATLSSLSPLPSESLSLAHTIHLLAPDVEVDLNAPTRLQLLCSGRGGEADVRDEELFAEGELEDILVCAPAGCDCGEPRDEKEWDEWERRRVALVEMWKEDEGKAAERAQARERRERRETKEKGKGKGKGRVDMEALARALSDGFGETGQVLDGELDVGSGMDIDMDSFIGFEGDKEESEEESMQDGSNVGGWRGDSSDDGDVVEVAEWRPVSPGGGGWDDRYDL